MRRGIGKKRERILLIIAQAARWRAAPIYTPKGHMYSRGWTKVVDDIMGVQRGFQFHMRESWTAQQEPFQPTEETDRRTKGRVSSRPTPPWKSPAGSFASGLLARATKQQLHHFDDTEIRQNTRRIRANPFLNSHTLEFLSIDCASKLI